MQRNISNIAGKKFDFLIVGGGINGCALAHCAAEHGLTVCVLDKNDFASGTSSRSTKLLHGGIRYLENFEFDLVRESLRERFIQWQSVPNLVKPMPFVIPVYKKDKRPLWMMMCAVWLYDFLSGKYRIGRHRFLCVEEVIGLVPGINREGLVGAVEYFDAQMNDARIVLENALMANRNGATLANYVEVLDFIKENGIAIGVKAQDKESGEIFNVFAKEIIVTVGPWADFLRTLDMKQTLSRMRLTKGVHVVYRGQIASHAFLIQSHATKDNRIFFLIPFLGHTLIGTTDTDYQGNPDDVICEKTDINDLLTEAQRVFPQLHFDTTKIITTFAGIRPLVLDKSQGQGPSKVSRKHVIEKTSSQVWFVMGGKFTTYRAIAQEVIRKVMPSVKLNFNDHYMLYGSGAVNQELKLLRHRYGVSIETIRYLAGLYGSRFEDVLKLTFDDPSLKEPLCECSRAIKAQVIYSQDVEMARSADDIFERRLNLQYNDCSSRNCFKTIEMMLRKG